MTAAYDELLGVKVGTRTASVLTGMVRSTAARRRVAATAPTPQIHAEQRTDPVNKLDLTERLHILQVLNSERFVDQAPLQIYAQLLDEGTYLCSVSTMYRVLAENKQVKDRRRQARHPARACPELVATAPRQVYSWDITKLAGPVKGQYFDAYARDRHLLPLHRRRTRPQPRIRGAGKGIDGTHLQRSRHPAGGPRRPRDLDDQQNGGHAAR